MLALPQRAPAKTYLPAGIRRAIAVGVFDPPPSRLQPASATTVIEKSTPLMMATMDSDQASKVVRSMKREHIIARPQIMTLNGREASIEIQHARSFVVGYKNSSQDGRQVFEPVTLDVNSGTLMRLRPELTGTDNVRLEFALGVSQIRSVETVQLPIKNGETPLQIQIPETVSTNVESSVDVQLGKTLVFGGLLIQDNEKPHQLLCLIHCERVATAVDQSDSSAEPKAVDTTYDATRDLPLAHTPDSHDSSPTLSSKTVLELGQSGEAISLRGNIRGQSPSAGFAAESIEWNPESSTVDSIRLNQISITAEHGR